MSSVEAGSKLVRLLSFVGAGVVCTAAINLWRDLERKSAHQGVGVPEKKNPTASELVHEAAES